MPKRIMLTLSDKLYEILSQKADNTGYMTTQELINDIIRKALFGSFTSIKIKKSNAGRPKHSDWESIIHRKKSIFGKRGVAPKI